MKKDGILQKTVVKVEEESNNCDDDIKGMEDKEEKNHNEHDDENKRKGGEPAKNSALTNKGEPFLEYIWTNGIPVNQERNETRLRIEEFKYIKDSTSNDESNGIFLKDFYLKVYWYERIPNKNGGESENVKTENNEEEIRAKENEEIRRLVSGNLKCGNLVKKKEQIIRRKDVFIQASAVRDACKALDHLRYMYKYLASNYTKLHEVS